MNDITTRIKPDQHPTLSTSLEFDINNKFSIYGDMYSTNSNNEDNTNSYLHSEDNINSFN